MSAWQTLNSPVIVSIISFFLVGILASAISAAWQRRSQRHSVRLMLAQEILGTYQDYLRFLRRKEPVDDSEDFDRLHASMVSRATIAKILFNEEIASQLQRLANKLATVHDLRIQGRVKKAKGKLIEIIGDADRVIENIFVLLK